MATPLRITRLSTATIALGMLTTSCVSYATGTDVPTTELSLATEPPSVALKLGKPNRQFEAELRHAIASSPYLSGTTEHVEQADIVVTVDRKHGLHGTNWVLLSVVLGGMLPLPVQEGDTSVLARMRVGDLDEVGLPLVQRTITYWGGIPLIPFFFLNCDSDAVQRGVATDLAANIAREYVALHERSWQAVGDTRSLRSLERFVQAFPTSVHAERASVELEKRLYVAADKDRSAATCLRYLRNFATSPRADTMRAWGANPVWQTLQAKHDESLLEEYVTLFAGQPQTVAAETALSTLLWRRAQRSSDDENGYRAYLKRFPNGKHARASADALAWFAVRAQRTPAAVQSYLRSHPRGRFATPARAALRRFADPKLAKLASRMPRIAADALRRQMASRTRRATASSGTLTSWSKDARVTLRYAERPLSGHRVEHRIKQGRIETQGHAFELGRDGKWYPAIPIQ